MCQRRNGLITPGLRLALCGGGEISSGAWVKVRAEWPPLQALGMKCWLVHWLPESHGVRL